MLQGNTYDESNEEDLKKWDREEEENPRACPKSPEAMFHKEPGQDQLTYLLDNVLEAQDKYVKMFPHMKHLINEQSKFL